MAAIKIPRSQGNWALEFSPVPIPTGEYRGLGDLHDGEYAQGLRGSLTVEIVIIIKQLKAFIIVHFVFFM